MWTPADFRSGRELSERHGWYALERQPGQALGGRRILDSHEALPLQTLEDRERRRQWFTALAVMPAPVRDRDLDEGG